MLKKWSILVRQISMTKTLRIKNRSTIILDAAFGKYLLVTNTLSSGILMLIGDLIDQELHHELKTGTTRRYDYGRLTRMFITGLSMGPVHHFYYKHINILWPARNFKSVSKKILADQVVMGPICILQFFYTLGFLERRRIQDINHEMRQKFLAVYMIDWFVWPPTQFINFYLIPYRYQVFYINFVTMLYDVFLSFMKYEI